MWASGRGSVVTACLKRVTCLWATHEEQVSTEEQMVLAKGHSLMGFWDRFKFGQRMLTYQAICAAFCFCPVFSTVEAERGHRKNESCAYPLGAPTVLHMEDCIDPSTYDVAQ